MSGQQAQQARRADRDRLTVGCWALALAGAVFLVDQVAKALVVSGLSPGEHQRIFFGLELAHVRNRGVAFGFLPSEGVVVTVAIVASLVVLLVYFLRQYERPGLWVAAGLVFGGALGNLADRVRGGAVVDFLDPPLWPTFNLADVAVVAGILVLLYAVQAPGEKGDGDER